MRSSLLLCCVLLVACNEPTPPEPQRISYKTRAENAPIRVLREHRLSETETLRVVQVPGWKSGERCVIYSSQYTSTMYCREMYPREIE